MNSLTFFYKYIYNSTINLPFHLAIFPPSYSRTTHPFPPPNSFMQQIMAMHPPELAPVNFYCIPSPRSGPNGPDQSLPTPPPAAPSSSSGEPGDDRRRRRMLSNRESARRSRMRKQMYLAELRSLVGRLRLHNRQMLDELNRVMGDRDRVELDNRRLREAELELRRRLEGSSAWFVNFLILTLVIMEFRLISTAWWTAEIK